MVEALHSVNTCFFIRCAYSNKAVFEKLYTLKKKQAMPEVACQTTDLSDVIPALLEDASAQETRADDAEQMLHAEELIARAALVTIAEQRDLVHHMIRHLRMRECAESTTHTGRMRHAGDYACMCRVDDAHRMAMPVAIFIAATSPGWSSRHYRCHQFTPQRQLRPSPSLSVTEHHWRSHGLRMTLPPSIIGAAVTHG